MSLTTNDTNSIKDALKPHFDETCNRFDKVASKEDLKQAQSLKTNLEKLKNEFEADKAIITVGNLKITV